MPQTLNWGILGTGHIASVMAKSFLFSSTATLRVVASREIEKARAFAGKHDVETAYGSYAELLADDRVEAVYIALPNHLHAEWTIRAAESGKHVLCEKPLAVNYREALEMVRAVKKADVFLMEAFAYRCHPQTARVAELIAAGTIGELQLIEGNFGIQLTNKQNVRYSYLMAGGSIMDLGVYPLSTARLLTGEEPRYIKGVARKINTPKNESKHPGYHSRVDQYSAVSIRFPSGCLAQLSCGFSGHMSNDVHVYGSLGCIHLQVPWKPQQQASFTLKMDGQEPETIATPCDTDLYALQADTVAKHLEDRQAPCMTWADSLAQARAVDRWRKSVNIRFKSEWFSAMKKYSLTKRPDAPITQKKLPGLDKPVAQLIMGSATFSQRDMSFVCTMLDNYIELGGNAIDTARSYGSSEIAIGCWMTMRANREDMIIIDKIAHPSWFNPTRLTPELIQEELTVSLDNLQTDYVDILMMHRDYEEVGVDEIMDILNECIAAGRVRALGASNWSVERIEQANRYARENNKIGFALNSPQFSLAVWNEPTWPDCLSATDPVSRSWHTENNFPMFAWSAQSCGFYTGKILSHEISQKRLDKIWLSDDNLARRERAHELAAQKNTNSAAIALAYIFSQPFPAFAVTGPLSVEELEVAAEGCAIKLTESELSYLFGGAK